MQIIQSHLEMMDALLEGIVVCQLKAIQNKQPCFCATVICIYQFDILNNTKIRVFENAILLFIVRGSYTSGIGCNNATELMIVR